MMMVQVQAKTQAIFKMELEPLVWRRIEQKMMVWCDDDSIACRSSFYFPWEPGLANASPKLPRMAWNPVYDLPVPKSKPLLSLE